MTRRVAPTWLSPGRGGVMGAFFAGTTSSRCCCCIFIFILRVRFGLNCAIWRSWCCGLLIGRRDLFGLGVAPALCGEVINLGEIDHLVVDDLRLNTERQLTAIRLGNLRDLLEDGGSAAY